MKPAEATPDSNAKLIQKNRNAMLELDKNVKKNRKRMQSLLSQSVENSTALMRNKNHILQRRSDIMANRATIQVNKSKIFVNSKMPKMMA